MIIKCIKKIVFVVLVSLFAQTLTVFAELPNSYYNLNIGFNAANDADDYNAVIDYGQKIINLISAQTQTDQTKNILATKYYLLGSAYYHIGDYENALKYFQMYIPYGRELKWDDGVLIAEAFTRQLPSVLEVYQPASSAQKTYGIKNEPNGVLFGQVSEKMQSNDSMVLLYLEYGDTNFSWANKIMRDARSQGKSVELALNYPNQGATARNIRSGDAYLDKLYSFIKGYSGVPVYLRIGAEFNIWNIKCKPDEFISSFRTIANKVRGLSNVSIVWGVAHTSTWKSAEWPYTMDDFYPGDEYVDWVGTNCYANKYFQAQRWSNKENYSEVCFKTGYSSDPVLMIKDIVEKYGNRKPIMISECGAAYRTRGSINENHDDWAASRVKEMYSLVPMVYPQVKLIAYFNNKISEELNYYDLGGSNKLSSAYNNIIKEPWFIHGRSSNSAGMFFKKADTTITTGGSTELYAYPHLFGADSVTVTYYIDNNQVGRATEPPYKVQITGLRGAHTLKVVANGSNGSTMSKEYTITGNAPAERADDFSDSSSLSAVQKNAVDRMVQKKIITGYDDNTLRPAGTVTRAEFTAMLCRSMGYGEGLQCSFSDARDHWASKYIQTCVSRGAIDGIGNNLFAPDDNVKFEQAVKIVVASSGLVRGYDIDSMGGYPSAYIKIGRGHDLFKNIENPVSGDDMTRIDAIMLINNIMSADTAPVSTPWPTATPTPRPTPRATAAPVAKTLYRYRDKETTTSTSSSMSGWTRVSSSVSYGNWSAFQDSYIAANSTTEVRTREVQTETKHYRTQYWYGGYFWTQNGVYQSSARPKSGVDNTFRDTGWLDHELEFSQDFGNGYIMYRNPSDGLYYFRNPYDSNYQGPTREVYDHSTYESKTQYSSRSVRTLYTYECWGDWSTWRENRVSGSSTRQVETKTVYE